MQNNRLTVKNQWGTVLYIGPNKKGIYRNIGDYAEDLTNEQIQLIMERLYIFEEAMADILEGINAE